MSLPLRLLQIEDSASDAALIGRLLEKADYRVEALRVEDAPQMQAALAAGEWDAIIADYRLPDFDAPAALAVLHGTGRDIPFIVVSGTIGEENAVALMKAGAHDYLMKDNLARLAPTVAREVAEARRREEGRRAKAELQLSHEALRALAARLQTVREEQSAHIAREIHDVLGQQLTALKLDLAWLKRRSAAVPDPALATTLTTKLAATSDLVDTAIQTVQKVATELRPGTLDKLGLAVALTQEAREFAARSGVRCEVEPMPEWITLSPERATGVFRIFQETLTNIARHARATTVQIRLVCEEKQLVLEVRDNGQGIAAPQLAGKKSLGLLGMHERAHLLGGQLDIAGEEGRGTTVRLTLPYSSPS